MHNHTGPFPSHLAENTGDGELTIATNALDGAVPVAFPAQPCHRLTIVNDSGTRLEVTSQHGASRVKLPASYAVTFVGITDASEFLVRRGDRESKPALVKAIWTGA